MSTITSARELLRDCWQRRAAWVVVGRGGRYYESEMAERPIVVEAIAALKARADRRSCRGIAEKARHDEPGRIVRLADARRRKREAEALARWERRVASGKLGLTRARRELRDPKVLARLTHRVSNLADGAIRLAVRCVGPIGDQAKDDLSRMRTSRDGSIGRNHGLERETTLQRIEALADWSAALITLKIHRHYYSRNGCGHTDRRHVGGDTYQCVLVLRDATTGEAHLLRVPPKFGNADTQFFGSLGSPRERIQAAVAWTFGLAGREYRPAVEA